MRAEGAREGHLGHDAFDLEAIKLFAVIHHLSFSAHISTSPHHGLVHISTATLVLGSVPGLKVQDELRASLVHLLAQVVGLGLDHLEHGNSQKSVASCIYYVKVLQFFF